VKITIKEYIPRSWFHPIGAAILSKQFSARSPNLCNAIALTFTVNRQKFATPLQAWAAGVQRSADFMESFRKKYGPTEYFIGLEFHKEDGEGEAWPHWHCILLRRGTYPQALLEEMWGYGFVWVNRIYDTTLDYFLKYVTKCYAAVPEWVLPLNRIRRVRYSRHFLAKVVKEAVEVTGEKRAARAQRTIGERLADWASRCTVTCGDKTTSAKTRQPWKQLLRNEIRTLLDNGSYEEGFGVLNIETTNNKQTRWLMKNLWVYRPLAKVTTDSACVGSFSPPRLFGSLLLPRMAGPPPTTCVSCMRSIPSRSVCSKSRNWSDCLLRVSRLP
jgi:hypothetical protein